MNSYLTLALLTGLALFQTSFVSRLTVLGLQPDLMLIVIVSWSLLRGAVEGMTWAFIGGLILDLISGGPFGLFTVSLVLASLLTGVSDLFVFRSGALVPGMIVALATLLYNVTFLLIFLVLDYGVSWGVSLAQLVGLNLLVNLVALPLVYFPLRWLHHFTGAEEISW